MVQQMENQEAVAPEPLTMKTLLEAGVHFGHPTRRWNPRMKPYIFTQRNAIHIIDLQQTLTLLERACQFVTDLTAEGSTVLFVGTKKQAQESVAQEAQRCGMCYVNQRWLGGTLTNLATIRSRIEYMKELEEQEQSGMFQMLPKKEVLKLTERLQRLRKYFNGIRDLEGLPDALFVIDIVKEDIAVAEARRMGVPIIGLVDTDANPDLVDCLIPGNDDAIRSIRLMCTRIADAVIQGRQRYEAVQAEAEAAAEAEATQEEMTEATAEAEAAQEETTEEETVGEDLEPTESVSMSEDTTS